MIIDLKKFINEERPFWIEFESILDRLGVNSEHKLSLKRVERFHYLYQRASSDLAKIMTFSSEPNIRQYLESLVGRAYGIIHETRRKPHRLSPINWFFTTFPQTFRRHINAFWIALTATLLGCVFGAFMIIIDSDAKGILMPFSHLQGDPSERVEREEQAKEDRLKGSKTLFSSYLMTHNTKVSITTLAMGMTWGIGTLILLFYNGVILGAVVLDYIMAGEIKFLMGWLLPHGVVEIPAIILAGQAGLVLGSALIGWSRAISLKMRLKKVMPDLVTLIGGVAVMLVWAGIIEAFFSQYHEPVLPYEIKIGFGVIELVLLILFFLLSGTKNVLKRKYR